MEPINKNILGEWVIFMYQFIINLSRLHIKNINSSIIYF
jgi:hypothetical protein